MSAEEAAEEDVILRVARPGDAAQLVALCREHARHECLEPCDDAGFEARLAAALAAGRLQAWLAWRGEEALGYASLTLDFSTLSARPFAHLDCLYLRPAARGRGLGLRLLQRVKQRAMALGCAELQWQTPDWNAAAVRFYLRLGATLRDKKRFTLALDAAA